jgi:hypothetical protein
MRGRDKDPNTGIDSVKFVSSINPPEMFSRRAGVLWKHTRLSCRLNPRAFGHIQICGCRRLSARCHELYGDRSFILIAGPARVCFSKCRSALVMREAIKEATRDECDRSATTARSKTRDRVINYEAYVNEASPAASPSAARELRATNHHGQAAFLVITYAVLYMPVYG